MSNRVADPRTGTRAIRQVVYDEATLARRVRELGREVTQAYPDGDLLLIGLLKGSFIFLADLVRPIERPLQVDFLVASSYGTEAKSSGQVRLLYEPAAALAGRHILLVEDIIDSGRTLASLMDRLRSRGPRSLAICALLDKHIAPPCRDPVHGFDGSADVPGRVTAWIGRRISDTSRTSRTLV